MDPLSAGISAAGSLIGNVFGASSTNSANKMNYRIFKESSQFNRQERVAAQNWQKQMIDYQNAYNSPLEQRKRLEQGGYNPYLNQASANLSAVLSSSPQASAPGSPTMQSFTPDMSATQQIASMLFSDPLQKANIDKINADKKKAAAETAGQLLENAFQSDSYEARKKAIELNNDLINEQKNLTHEQIDYTKAQTALLNVNREAQEYLNKWLPIDKQMSLMTSLVSLDNMLKQGKILDRQYNKLAYEIVYQQLLNTGQRWTNDSLDAAARTALATYQMAIDATNAEHLDNINMYNSRINIPYYWDINNSLDLFNKATEPIKYFSPGVRDLAINKASKTFSSWLRDKPWGSDNYWNYRGYGKRRFNLWID